MPARVAVPLPLSTKVTPLGSVPTSERAAFGIPVVVTEKDPAEPTLKVVALAEVIEGAVPIVIAVVDSTVPRVCPVVVWYASLGPLPCSGVVFDSSM